LRIAAAALFLALFVHPAAHGQAVEDAELHARLAKLFPQAVAFSGKSGSPPHYKALGEPGANGEPELLGYAYWTTELEPLERGYDGPIKILVGMDTSGVITGIIVTEDHEPYGYFSVELPEFADQFKGKSVRDRFQVGSDIDAITRATISVTSASRAVRNSSRRIARAYLVPPKDSGASGEAKP
jgi:NosR/NirI family nitrous oxide reductase transcriptional regulator